MNYEIILDFILILFLGKNYLFLKEIEKEIENENKKEK